MKILVTGATGRIGSRLVPRLLQRGNSVRILVRHPERAEWLQKQGAEIAVGDLRDQESLAPAVKEVDTVVHLAAVFRGATPAEVEAANLTGTLTLARAALHGNVERFVFTSTNLVYGPGNGGLFQEKDPVRPAAPYPESKAAAEQALNEFHRTGRLGLRILRLAFVYGEGDPHLAEGINLFRQWNPNQKIHLVHHVDVAQAVMLATDKSGIDGQMYNVADDEPVTIGEIMQVYGEPIAEDASRRQLDAAWHQLVDTRKIRDQLGFHAIYPALRNAVSKGAL